MSNKKLKIKKILFNFLIILAMIFLMPALVMAEENTQVNEKKETEHKKAVIKRHVAEDESKELLSCVREKKLKEAMERGKLSLTRTKYFSKLEQKK